MSTARRALVAALAAVAVGSAAGPANATEETQMVNEKTGLVCTLMSPPHTSGGCITHLVGSATIRMWVMGFEFENGPCQFEFEMRMGHNGRVAIYDVDWIPDTECSGFEPILTACDLPWEGTAEEISPATVGGGAFAVCFVTDEFDTTCTGAAPFTITEGASETYDLAVDGAALTPVFPVDDCELDLDLAFESTQAQNAQIHINHL